MWRELHRLAYDTLRRRGLSHTDAEDLAQETLIAAYQHLDGIEEGRLRAWVCAVARNKLADWARKKARHPEVFEAAECADADRLADPAAVAILRAEQAEIEQMFSSLSERDRTVLELRYLSEMSTAEVAERVALPVSATKVALHRARTRLRAMIEKTRRSS